MSYIKDLQKYSKDHFFYKEAMEAVEKFDKEAYVVDGIVRWKGSNNIPPTEFLELWDHFNKDFSLSKTMNAHDEELHEILNQYRNNQYEYMDEELFELKSAFGENETIVNIITGQTIRL